MKTLNVMLSNLGGRVVPIGYEGENLYTRIRINCIEVFSEYPDATVSMVVSPPDGEMYPAVVEKSGVMVIWDITDSVLSSNGSGECQLTFTEGNVVRKSVVFGISINRSLVASGEAPEPVQEWIDRAEQTAQEIAENAAMLAKQDIVESYGEIAPAIIETASGAIASFSDGADGMLVKKMTVDIDPVQDLHGYDSPWPAGGGANKFNEDTELGAIGSNGIPYSTNDSIRSKTFSSCKGSTGYYVHGTVAVYFYDSSENFIEVQYANNNIKTSPANAAYFKVGFYGTYGTTYKYDTAVNDPSSVTTYSPYENICPISGWESANVSRTGVNVWDEAWESGYINTTTGAKVADVSKIRTKNPIPVKPNTTYYYKTPVAMYICSYDADMNFIQRLGGSKDTTITTPSNCAYIMFGCESAYGTTYNHDISINYPSTDTQYHAYSGSTAEYEFPQEAGTVYGGTLTIHQDGSGELVVKRDDVDLGTLTWERYNNKFFRASLPSSKVTGTTQGQPNAICSIYRKAENGSVVYNATEDKVFIVNSSFISSAPYVSIADSDYTDADAFESAMSGVQLVYELATPVTYQLTNQQVIALLKGSNNIWADTGNVSLEYPADTKLYIDGKVAELQALILENISNS